MSAVAQARYQDSFIAGFETRKSMLPAACSGGTENRAGTVYFLVASSGGRSAVSRGPNGIIPPSDDSQTQIPVVFTDDHDKSYRTGFDIFTAQADQLQIMRAAGMAVLNRKIDSRIITAAEATTIDLGAIGTMNKVVANKITTKLRNAHAGEDTAGMVHCLLTPAAWAYLEDVTAFASTDYSATGGKLQDGTPIMGMWKYWAGMMWGVHTGLTGVGTSTATCLAWHKAAMGYVVAPGGIKTDIGPDPGEDRSFALHTIYHSAKLLQNAGVIKFTHDDSAFS